MNGTSQLGRRFDWRSAPMKGRRAFVRASMLGTLAGCLLIASHGARAWTRRVRFAKPVVESAQGQKLRVLLPFSLESTEMSLSATAVLVTRVEAPTGYKAPKAGAIMVTRPSAQDVIVLSSPEVVDAPTLAIVFSVAGDPESPYRVELVIPDVDRPVGSLG